MSNMRKWREKNERQMEQLSIFQFIYEDHNKTNENAIKLAGMRYTDKDIYKSSDHRKFLREKLVKSDTKGVYVEFKEAFRTYGFYTHDKSFCAFKNKGEIRYKD